MKLTTMKKYGNSFEFHVYFLTAYRDHSHPVQSK
jgi:hypothetical protein